MITRIEPGKRMSQAVVANGFVFLAGQVATDPHAVCRSRLVRCSVRSIDCSGSPAVARRIF